MATGSIIYFYFSVGADIWIRFLIIIWKILMLIYLISMYKSCFPSGHYFSIDKASDLTGMKSVVHMNHCDHVPLQKYEHKLTVIFVWFILIESTYYQQ